MHIYFCHKKNEDFGRYIAAVNRSQAKQIYVSEVGCSYTDVRSQIFRRGVNIQSAGLLSKEIGTGDTSATKGG